MKAIEKDLIVKQAQGWKGKSLNQKNGALHIEDLHNDIPRF